MVPPVLRISIAGAFAGATFLACSSQLAGATTVPAVQRTAKVVVGRTKLELAPGSVKTVHGYVLVVVFRIHNTGGLARRFVIDRYRSPFVPPGTTRNYSVAFYRTGRLACSAVARTGKPLRGTFVIRR
jgi:hypothetical protein